MTNIYGTYNMWAARYGYDDSVADSLHGSYTDDYIVGYGGADTLVGNGGHDEIYGGRGNDWITRRHRLRTRLTGGTGRRHVRVLQGRQRSQLSHAADVITDFNMATNSILFQTSSPAGTSSNYVEFAFSGRRHLLGHLQYRAGICAGGYRRQTYSLRSTPMARMDICSPTSITTARSTPASNCVA